jgi:hypothetical protein
MTTTKEPHETVDWSKFDRHDRAEVECRCGMRFRSHVKGVYAVHGPQLVSRQPCPGCESHVGGYRAEFPPETVTIGGRS